MHRELLHQHNIYIKKKTFLRVCFWEKRQKRIYNRRHIAFIAFPVNVEKLCWQSTQTAGSETPMSACTERVSFRQITSGSACHEEGHRADWDKAWNLEIKSDSKYRKYKESAHIVCLTNPISQQSLEISTKWTSCTDRALPTWGEVAADTLLHSHLFHFCFQGSVLGPHMVLQVYRHCIVCNSLISSTLCFLELFDVFYLRFQFFLSSFIFNSSTIFILYI
jgi:hypothetical protein